MPETVRKTPIRVLFVDHTAMIGGGEIALINLIRTLDRQLVHPIVLLYEAGPLADRLGALVETHVLPLPTSVGGARKDDLGWKSLLHCKAIMLALRHVWTVSRLAKRLKIDLIHTNSLKADVIGGLAARLAGIPVVWHVRDRIDSDYLPAAVVCAFRLMAGIVPNFVIANSAATLATLHLRQSRRSAAIASGVSLLDRRSIVHDGCDVLVAESVMDPSSELLRVGLIGRISPWKGQHIFLRAAARLKADHPTMRFEIIGAPLFSEHEYEARLRELRRELELEDTVEFVGFVENIPTRIAALDIVVHASTTGEPFGQVIVEAMASQKPVVATDGGGVPEIVLDGVTGILVPMGDAEKMAEAIAWLMDHREAAAQMGRNGRHRVLDHFTIQRTARLVESVYRDVLQIDRGNPIGFLLGTTAQPEN